MVKPASRLIICNECNGEYEAGDCAVTDGDYHVCFDCSEILRIFVSRLPGMVLSGPFDCEGCGAHIHPCQTIGEGPRPDHGLCYDCYWLNDEVKDCNVIEAIRRTFKMFPFNQHPTSVWLRGKPKGKLTL